MQVSDMSSQAPVGTTLAIMERTLKVMSAVQARIHYSLKQELNLLKGIIAEFTPEEYDYEPTEGSRRAKKSDYDNVDVIPVSDPNAATMAQKIVQYQAALQLAQTAPQLYNLPLLHRQMLDVLGIKNAQKLIPMDEDFKPTDPVSENQNILMSKPVKAFLTQDHAAHITTHLAMAQDPKIQALVQQSPMKAQIEAQLMAHVQEHLGMQYRVQIEQQLGVALPPMKDESGEDINMPPAMEAQLAPLLAQAAQQVLMQSQAQVAQQQAMAQAQDPLVQMQQQEVQIKAAEQARKERKDQADIILKQEQLDIERQRILVDANKEDKRTQADLAKHDSAQRHDGMKHMTQLMANSQKTNKPKGE